MQLYKNLLTSIIDKHAPLKRKLVSNKPKVPWFNDSIAAEIRKRRRLEKIWQKDINNTEKYLQFYKQRSKVSNIIDHTEKTHLQEKLVDDRNNYKQVFNICNNLLGRKQDLPLPPCKSKQELAGSFNNFYIDKMSRIRCNLKDINADTSAETTDVT